MFIAVTGSIILSTCPWFRIIIYRSTLRHNWHQSAIYYITADSAGSHPLLKE